MDIFGKNLHEGAQNEISADIKSSVVNEMPNQTVMESSSPRVFIINTDPRNTDLLTRCLKTMHSEDFLYLMADGVNALLDEAMFDILSDVPNLYISSFDMNARSISIWCGEEANASHLVALIAKYGNPITFK
ncbi:DsrH/TusB family sulfur metabolism protein [Succinimonas amylolytica]|uniref:DsrH/TusB family sulfur metabolism protein n=1 Tax=Succinimonas amylolytica TaxID=83769 RepID=UPI0003693FC0|nr:DsrH/TusB family sulfur metabolism protein [Succinimonas amylolytica]